MSINLKVPDTKELKPRITVVGVGGAGGNAVNNMIKTGLEGVDFVVANTDAQALAMSSAERCIQMGTAVTEGLGAGSKPEIGAAAAEETIDEIKSQLDGSHMVFITAGMGGGTGTGAAPVIAKTSFEQNILTVGVVTKPFQFEGKRRMLTADEGIKKLAKQVDTLLVIPNQNLFRVATEKTTFADAFALADQVLHSGVACITDLMVKEGLINLDFADVKAVMAGMGKAMMGTGEASGDKRAIEAAEAAISNPLLDDVSMKGASGLLISITGGNDLTLYEVDEAASRIREEVDADANIILGATFDEALDGQVRVSVVATGLDQQTASAGKSGEGDVASTLADRISALTTAENDAAQKEPAGETAEKKVAVKTEPAEVTIEKRAPQAPATAKTAAAKQQKAFVPQPPSMAKTAPRRMPKPEEFPQVVQNEIKARSGEAEASEEVGIRAQKRKIGFFERLTGGRKSKEADVERSREPAMKAENPAQKVEPAISTGRAAPAPSAPKAKVSRTRLTRDAGTPKAPSVPVMVKENEEDLEIPAFLKRQA
jgi:cell division protein FtsZ